MWKLLRVCWFASVCVGYELTQWQMGTVCGVTIARGLAAGELLFRADDFSSSSGDTCMVVVKLEDESGIRERTVLYFTEFKLDTSCRDNVTVVNGDWSVDWRGEPSTEDVVAGLPMQLCGHNKTLEEVEEARFFTVDPVFTVIYHRTASLPSNDETFVMKFATYHEGECNTDRFYKCSNDHCISKDLRCHGDIEACGEKDSNCLNEETAEAVKSFLEYLKDLAVDVLYLIAIFIGMAVLSCVYQRCKNSHGDIRNFPIIRDILSRIDSPTTRPETPESVSLRSVQDDDVQVTVEGETELDRSSVSTLSYNTVTSQSDNDTSPSAPAYDTLNVDNNMTSSGDDPTSPSAPAYDTLNVDNNMTSSGDNDTTPSAPSCDTTSGLPPPPSYDEVMSNQGVYGHNNQN